MGDFYQNGVITTLHNLNRRPVEELEAELRQFCQIRPLALILPSLFSELEGPALKNIIEELKKVDYLDEVIIGLDAANEAQYRYALEFLVYYHSEKRSSGTTGLDSRPLMQSLSLKGYLLLKKVKDAMFGFAWGMH